MEALKWLRQAHDIEQRVGEDSARSSTFLNLCAVYSLLGKHLEALQCATQALKHLKTVLQRDPDATLSASVPGMEKVDTASMLAIAYHNIAVEQEYLARYDEAVSSYRKALQVAETQCGLKSQLASKIRLALAAADAAASATLDSETSVASIESRCEPEGASEGQRDKGPRGGRELAPPRDRERERDKGEQDMILESLSVESRSEPGSTGRIRVREQREEHGAKNHTRTSTSLVPGQAWALEHGGAGAMKPAGREEACAPKRVPSAGTGGGGKCDAHVNNESSWGSERSPGSASSRERSKRPLSAARLPANDPNSSQEGPHEPRGAVKRHSRKTARPRTAGRERMADGDREELLAMTDPSSSDAGEYEAVADDAGLSDNESHAASRAGNKAWENEEEGGEGASVFGGKSLQAEKGSRQNGRPMSASRPADPLRAVGSSGPARTSRKTARPRTAGRERMRETDREDLLVLSSGSEDGGAYEYLSGGDDEPPRGSALVAGTDVRGERMPTSESGAETDVRGSSMRTQQQGGGKRRANRPLSAGVSFNSPSNVVHMMRPQSAPAVRLDGRRAAPMPIPQDGVDENEDEDDDDEEQDGLFDSDEEEHAPGAPSVGAVCPGWRTRPVDSGQPRPSRPLGRQGAAYNQASAQAQGIHKQAPAKGAPALPQLLHEEEQEQFNSEADEEELDTKGILMQQTEVLTAELEKSKQRERELADRISHLEQTRAPPQAAVRPPLPPTVPVKPVRKTAFGLPEVGLDSLIDEDEPPMRKSGAGTRALPPRPTNNVSRVRARSNLPGTALGGLAVPTPVDAGDDIAELTGFLRKAAQHKVSNSTPSSPAHSTTSSAAAASMADGPLNPVRLPLRDARRAAESGEHASTGRGAPSSGAAWASETQERRTPAGTGQPTAGELSDSSRASSVSRPAALRPLPASRRRRQKAEASRAAQLERVAAQTLQDAWRAHLARARIDRRRALARRRAARASAGAHAQRADRYQSAPREEGPPEGGRLAARHHERHHERAVVPRAQQDIARSRQAPGSAPARPAQQDKRKALAATTLQRVARGRAARRLVEQTLDWSLVGEARSQADAARCRGAKGSGGAAALGDEDSTAPYSDGSVLISRGTGRATPLHSTGVGEESLEGLLQDLGL